MCDMKASPQQDGRRRYVIDALACYWPRGGGPIAALPVPRADEPAPQPLPPRVRVVTLPDWAADAGVKGELLVADHHVTPGEGPDWQRTDWLAAADWFLNGHAECEHERRHGPIHSYALRLRGWDSRLWDHAWVNRIALFLRRWSARHAGRDEAELLGRVPQARFLLTHDVDAIRKTPAIRLKQTAFCLFNAGRNAVHLRPAAAWQRLRQAGRFMFSAADYWCFDRITELERQHGVTSTFFVYSGGGGAGAAARRGLKQRLLDPAYAVEREPRLIEQLRTLTRTDWAVGLHQSFDAWRDANAMTEQRRRLADALGAPVTACRQHWLRFSWAETWRAQQAAGLELDATLGFNDRPAFRNGSALPFHPWPANEPAPLRLAACPMVLMDSHLYDYAALAPAARREAAARWIGEVAAVGGQASIIWHQRVMSPDYGWDAGYADVLSAIAAHRTKTAAENNNGARKDADPQVQAPA
jgi:hypothetical protein